MVVVGSISTYAFAGDLRHPGVHPNQCTPNSLEFGNFDIYTPQRTAVGLCGLRPVPDRGHSALIADVSGRRWASGLLASLVRFPPSCVIGLACCPLHQCRQCGADASN